MEQHVQKLWLERIEQCSDFIQLRQIREQIQTAFVHQLHAIDSLQMSRDLNSIHDQIFQRTIVLSERQLYDKGIGPSPVSYAIVLFGSGGRGEQTLWSDQDHGLIYNNPPAASEAEAEAYFREFAEMISDGLGKLGYPPCEGKVFSTNSMWRKSIDDWQEMVEAWNADPDWEHIRYLLIMADMRFLYGSEALADQLKTAFWQRIESTPGIFQHMLRNTLHHKITLGLFGQLITERYGEDAGGMDIKYGAYIPFVNGIRLLAMSKGIKETSTEKRLYMLYNLSFISAELLEEWASVFTKIMIFRLSTTSEQKDHLYSTRGTIQADQLTKELRSDLKYVLKIGRELQRYVKQEVEGYKEERL